MPSPPITGPARYNSFLSVVCTVQAPAERHGLAAVINALYPILRDHFTDFEIILVNNLPELRLDEALDGVNAEAKRHVHLINLSNRVDKNYAILAGLDRANGDYTVIWEPLFAERPEWILDLYARTQENYDIVYLRAPSRRVRPLLRWLYGLFYWIMRRYSNLRVDDKAHNTRIISRRALNSLLRLRENLRYMKAIYSIVGYRTTSLPTHQPLEEDETLGERFKTSLVAITSFTTFLRTVMLWLFLFSVLFLVLVIVNALLVKFAGGPDRYAARGRFGVGLPRGAHRGVFCRDVPEPVHHFDLSFQHLRRDQAAAAVPHRVDQTLLSGR